MKLLEKKSISQKYKTSQKLITQNLSKKILLPIKGGSPSEEMKLSQKVKVINGNKSRVSGNSKELSTHVDNLDDLYKNLEEIHEKIENERIKFNKTTNDIFLKNKHNSISKLNLFNDWTF